MATSSSSTDRYVAAIVGATGATGAALLDALAKSDRISRVVAIARSPPPPPPSNVAGSSNKVEWKKLSLDDLARLAAAASASSSSSSASSNPLRGVDAVFCALGTTRADAGSARAFWDVDVGGVESVAKLASEQQREQKQQQKQPRVLSLVSASGASRGNPFFSRCTFPPFLHPLYYAAAKGAAEQALVDSGISHVFVYRPGLLDRGDGRRRGGERLALRCGFPSLAVGDLARVMVDDAVEALDKSTKKEDEGTGGGGGGGGEVVRGDAEIKRRAAAASAASSASQ